MTELLTAAQMRAIEQAAIESGEVTGLELMERAGAGVVEAIFEEWPELEGRGASPSRSPEDLGKDEKAWKAVVLCGPGNNGGDGFVVARLLKERGWEVEVFLYGDEAKLPVDAAENCRRWRKMGEVSKWNCDPMENAVNFQSVDLVIDALFGFGLSRPLSLETAALAEERSDYNMAFHGNFMVAIDTPSGLDSDSGKVIGKRAFKADLTVTFQSEKLVHRLGVGPEHCGVVRLIDLGINQMTATQALVKNSGLESRRGLGQFVCVQSERPDFLVNEESQLFPGHPRHKYDHGHAHILAGPPGRGGAARLAARGALRIGAGLVTVGCPADALGENAAQLNAVMVRVVDRADALAGLLDSEKINALCLGPGLGLNDGTKDTVAVALKSGLPCVLDADGLSIFENNERALFGLLHDGVVITPHAGEFKRLFPDIAAKLAEVPTKGPAYSKVDATREAAARAGCVVLFKGADTVIAAPDGYCAINSAHYERSAPWLATAGSGDVLAGFITGLLARGFSAKTAAETAAWLHVECARSFGPGLIAEDLPEELPKVFRQLGV